MTADTVVATGVGLALSYSPFIHRRGRGFEPISAPFVAIPEGLNMFNLALIMLDFTVTCMCCRS